MSNSIIKRAVARLVQSKEFMDVFTGHLMLHLEQELRSEAAGDKLYIPKTSDLENKAERDHQIRTKFTGNNLKTLALTYGLSEKQIRRICCKK